EALGSICSGGRYDALATDGRTTYPGVGISLGVSRVLVPLISRTGLVADRSVPSAVLVALVDDAPEARAASEAVADALRARDVACEVSPSPQKFGKQIRYAERRGIPFVWFTTAEGGHEVKDIRSGEQVTADPAAWTPPHEDLRPQVTSHDPQEMTK
ncbi:His/Gly/Thr/Pro-type tRNA ligase C-terminal domain-containing protein, partial [Nocardioides kribbensis]